MTNRFFASTYSKALLLLTLGSLILAGTTVFQISPALAQAQPIVDLDPNCGTSTSVDAAPVGSTGSTWIAYDCPSSNTVKIVQASNDGSSVSEEPQTISDSAPADVFVTSSSSGKALILANNEDGHIHGGTCTSGGTCTEMSNPDNPTPPPDQTVTLASGVDTSEGTCDEEPCTIDNDNFYDTCNDGCNDPAIVVTSPPETYGWDTIPDTQWISGSPDGTGFGSEVTDEHYFSTTTFDLPGNAQNPSLTMSILADGGAEVFLNGNPVGSTEGDVDDSSNYQNPPTVLSTNNEEFFNIGGENSLSFIVSNVDDPMGLDYKATITYDEIIIGALPNYNSNPMQSIGFNPFSNNAQITPVHVTPGGNEVSHPVGAFGIDDNTLYAAWEDRTVGNTDIMFARSDNGGTTWSTSINLSHNNGASLSPRMVASGNNVFVTWEDDSSGNTEILFSRSTDGGMTFGDPRNLSSTPGASTDHEIALDGSRFYVVWRDSSTGNGDIYLKRSTNGGSSFLSTQRIESRTTASTEPDIDAKTIGGSRVVNIVWSENTGQPNKKTEAMFAQSTDGGSSFLAKAVSNTRGDSVKVLVSIARDNVRYVAWLDNQQVPGSSSANYRIWASMSTNGATFNTPQLYSEREGKALAAFEFDLADKVCAWDPHCSRCQGDTYGDENGAYSYGASAPLVSNGWLW
jgi:hypothetical protein